MGRQQLFFFLSPVLWSCDWLEIIYFMRGYILRAVSVNTEFSLYPKGNGYHYEGD